MVGSVVCCDVSSGCVLVCVVSNNRVLCVIFVCVASFVNSYVVFCRVDVV